MALLRVWGEPWRWLYSLPGPGPAPLAAPGVLTADCRGQAGCLGAGLRAGFPARRGLQGPSVPGGSSDPASPLPRVSRLVGQVQRDCDISSLLGLSQGRIGVPDTVLPGGKARTLGRALLGNVTGAPAGVGHLQSLEAEPGG